ncbi:MAG: adenosylcobinamide-GDP ribazoletransferase [Phycisphaerae bacterium]
MTETPPQPHDRPLPAVPARWRWSGALRAAARLLFRGPATREPPGVAAAMTALVVPLGLLVGLAWLGVFRATWRVYGEVDGLRVIPALAVVLLEALISGRYLLLSAAQVADLLHAQANGRDAEPSLAAPDATPGWHGTLILGLLLLAFWALLVSVPVVNPWWPEPEDWRSKFNWLYPRPIYRHLLLAPLWGRWGVLLAACLGRTARRTDATTQAFCRAASPARLLRHSILPVSLTCIYFSRERNFLIGAVIGLAVLACSYLASVTLARRLGGQSRTTLLATGQIAQLAFLALYRAMWKTIYAQ